MSENCLFNELWSQAVLIRKHDSPSQFKTVAEVNL